MAFHLTQSELNALAKVDKAPYDLAPIPSLSLLLLLPHSIPPSLSSSHTGLFPFSFKSLALSCLRAFALSSPSALRPPGRNRALRTNASSSRARLPARPPVSAAARGFARSPHAGPQTWGAGPHARTLLPQRQTPRHLCRGDTQGFCRATHSPAGRPRAGGGRGCSPHRAELHHRHPVPGTPRAVTLDSAAGLNH